MAKKKDQTINKDVLLAAIIALILGLGGGYGITQLTTDDSNVSDTSTESTEETAHTHSEMYEVDVENAPTVKIMVEEDAKSGWNVRIITTNFTFAPENVNGMNVEGEGHAHLYVDGVKISRVYGDYFYYGEEFDGTKTFKVSLNANDHSEYTVDGVPITAAVEVTHDHETMPHAEESMDHDSEDSHAH